jgi:hypothetical protein
MSFNDHERALMMTATKSHLDHRKIVGPILAICGTLLSLLTLNQIIFASLPLAISKPEWQLAFMGSLSSNGPLLLVGFLFMYLSSIFGRSTSDHELRLAFVQRLSYYIAILYFILIPLMAFGGVKLVMARQGEEENTLNQWRRVNQAINDADNEAELLNVLKRLPRAPALPNGFNVPFADAKRQISTTSESNYNALVYKVQQNRSSRWQTFLLEYSKSSISSFLVGIGFSSMGKLGNVRYTLLQRLRPSLYR